MVKVSKKTLWISTACFLAVAVIVLSVVLPIHYFVNAWYSWRDYRLSDVETVSFRENVDEFKILQLTDTHVQSVEQLDYARDSFRELIEQSDPDMLVFTGDFVWKKHTKELLPKYLAMIDEFKIPYAFVYGNHDLEGNADVKDFVKAFKNSEYGIYSTGPKNIAGNSNYAVNVTKDGKVVYTLMMLDSQRYASAKNTVRGFNYIHDNQVNFYEWNIKGASEAVYGEFNPDEGKVVPSLIFYHVPQLECFELREKILAEYRKIMEEEGLDEMPYGRETQYGAATLSDDAEPIGLKVENGYRESDENLYPIKQSNLIEKAAELQSTKAIFMGHLHYNTGHYKYYSEQFGQTVDLVHGTKTLTTSLYYGCEQAQSETKVGGTLISIKADGSYAYDRLYSTIFAPEFKH